MIARFMATDLFRGNTMRTRWFLAGCLAIAAAMAVLIILAQPFLSAQPPAQKPAPKFLENAEITTEGGVNFYTTYQGKRLRSLAISPGGSLIAGGVSRKGTPFTNEPPTIDPTEYDKAGASGGRNWIHDFYFGRFGKGEGQPRLYTRGMFLWGRGDSPDIQLGRTGPDNTENYPVTTYGPPTDTLPGTSLGKIVFLNWGEGEFQGDLARITARNDTVATKTKNPGSLHFATAGPSVGTDAKQAARAWRDGIDRLVIRSNGYVGIGDGFSGAAERLHVQGNIRADGNVQAAGDVVAKGAKKFAIEHPTRPGKILTHAALEGPEVAVYYRGEGQLVEGRAVIELPEYFEALTQQGQRTVILTNVDGFDGLAVQRQAEMQVKDGKFVVVSNRPDSTQRFTWEVKALRGDVGALAVESAAEGSERKR
jgi:hypothetical protein